MAASGNPLHKSQSRRVSSSSSSSKPVPLYDMPDSESLSGRRKCSSCCGCIGMLIGVVLIIILLLIIIFFAFLQSCLPTVHFNRLDIKNIQANPNQKQYALSANVDATINATNSNSKIELHYSSMKAVLSTSGVTFDGVKLNDMRQGPHGMNLLVVRTSANKKPVEEIDAKELTDNYKKHALLVNLVVKGKVGFYINGQRISSLPFKIDCHSIDQERVDSGKAPGCKSQMSFIN